MIVFVGSEEKGFFIRDAAQKHHWECAYVRPELDIRSQVSRILEYQEVKVIVYDISQYDVPGETVADVIVRIQKANNAKPVIFAEGYQPRMEIIRQLAYRGITDCIYGTFLADKKAELEDCISGKRRPEGEAGSLDEEEAGEREAEPGNPVKGQPVSRTIGIAGATARMGTTTQAIQFVKYLLFQGYRACYIQMNGHGWVEELKEAYADAAEEEETGKVTYQSVDMFYKLEKLPEVMKLGYDFYVYDYGVYSERGFNKVSFLEKELQVFVVGTKPGEFMKTYELIGNNFYSRVSYIFNFIPDVEEEREETYGLMREKRDAVYFAPDCRDPFVFSGSGIYGQMLPVERIAQEPRKTKRGLFRKRR